MTAHPLVRNVEDAERRWFYGGAEQTWLAKAGDTAGSFLLATTVMVKDKVTPLHTHPADESMVVMEGELLVHLDGGQHPLRAGGFSLAPAGVPHAFKVVSESATVLFLHTPGTCEAFYLGASTPLAPGETTGPVDMSRIMESGRLNGGFELVGPPPF
ncbi:cupin domain-containing protein [uncultured Nocardioides sp.]|uniref:cupin domain-containing protein n=1 Tax=uncultured Nocardioides sp. TaxID=198441 RepID=UPI002627EA75|nr:cupin domain-containing protein [uncultured Nocardioides sp.]